MKIFKYLSVVAFTALCSSVSYSAENATMESILNTFYSGNPQGRALAKYCSGCKITDSSRQRLPTYDTSKTNKPTLCNCDVDNSYVYNVPGKVCQLCKDGFVATVNAVDCQKIVCPAGYYRKEVSSWDAPCPMGTIRQVFINKNNTYVNPNNKNTTYSDQFK